MTSARLDPVSSGFQDKHSNHYPAVRLIWMWQASLYLGHEAGAQAIFLGAFERKSPRGFSRDNSVSV